MMETIFKLVLNTDKHMRTMVICTCMLFGYYVQETYQADNCIDLNYNDTSYLFCYSSKGRNIAEQECKNNSMQLAVISTDHEFSYWRSYFRRNHSLNQIWVGATFSTEQQAFVWDTGGNVPLSFFGNNPPNVAGIKNGTCLRIFTNQWLEELDCSEKRGSLCQEMELSTTILPATTVNTSIAEEDTAILTTSVFMETTEVSSLVTNVEANQTKGDVKCMCSCVRVDVYPNDTNWLMYALDNITRELWINQLKLSAKIRKKTSISDNRPMARGIGYSGVIILISISLTIVLMDLTKFIHCRNCRCERNIKCGS